MPKDTQKPQFIKDHRNLCANCGQPAEPNLAAHYKKVHQRECVVTYNGEKVTVYRGEDERWHCLECPQAFAGYPKCLQDHVRNVHGTKKPLVKKPVKSEGDRSQPQAVLDAPKDQPDYSKTVWSNDVKSEPISPEDILPPPLLRRTESTASYHRSAIPTPSETATPEPVSRQPTSLPLPPALDVFFDSLRIPLQHIADVFIENGFDTEESLDLLCETPPEDGWAHMKDEILARARLAGWLAVQTGLKQRAQKLATHS